MRIIGLTGSIACGKSTVSAHLLSRGFPVIDGDKISREMTSPGTPAAADIYRIFGPDVFYEDGSLNRRRLGRIVFSDDSARRALDELMAPYLLSETRSRIEHARASGAPLCFLDMPLLFEKGYDRLCDTVWTVWLPQSLQSERLIKRDGFTREEAEKRIAAVLSSDEKALRSDRVIDNSGTIEETLGTVDGFLQEEIRQLYQSKPPRPNGPDPVPAPASQSMGDPLPSQILPGPMKRPDRSAHHSVRKAAWSVPVWLKASLAAVVFFLMVGFTSLMLMNAYLARRTEEHISEQRRIDSTYPLAYRSMIEKYASEYNLSAAFVAAVIRNESSFQPKAESGVGARGLMQLMPDTAEWIAGKLKVSGYAFERMYDPDSNIRFGCWYLNYLSNLFLGNPVSVTAAYHAGQGQIKTWLSDPLLSEDGYSLSLSSMPDGPTKLYTGRVIRDYGIYQKKYFTPDPNNPGTDIASLLPRAFIFR